MLRACFAKTGNAIWISHLDLMRVLQRSFRRAGLLLKHSQGFTPHPALSLALPLPVGVASECEIMDFELAEGQDIALPTLAARLNAVLPEGIHIYHIYEGGAKVGTLTHLRIAITMEYDRGIPEGCEEAMRILFQQDALMMEKKTKSGAIVMQNILEMMQDVSFSRRNENVMIMNCLICAQNPSLNPAMIIAAIRQALPALAPDFSKVCRLSVHNAQGEQFQ